jgi:autotransporter-associated beta strand protein
MNTTKPHLARPASARLLAGLAFVAAVLTTGPTTAQAQTAHFTNTLGGDWNTAGNWDLDFTGVNVVPAEATNASLAAAGAAIVNYDTPMAATSFGSLTLDGGVTLNINAAGFNQDQGVSGAAPLTIGNATVNLGAGGVWNSTNGSTAAINAGGNLNVAGSLSLWPLPATAPLNVATGGVVKVTGSGVLKLADGGPSTVGGTLSVTDGSLVITNCTSLTLSPGGAINLTNGTLLQTASPSGTVTLGANNNNTTTLLTMYGGNVTFDRVLDIRGRKSGFILNGGTLNANGGTLLRETSTDDLNRLVVNGGTANLGATEINRTASGGGLILSNGVANTTSLRIGVANSTSYATIYGGILTNTGLFTICDRTNGAVGTTDRRARLLIRGGTVVSTGSSGIIVANQGNLPVGGTAAAIAGILDVNSGTLIAEGITLIKDNTLTNAHAQMTLTGSGAVYLGSVGLNANTGPVNTSYALTLSGGTLAAKANYTANANGTLSGTFTAQAADAGGNPFNITNTAVWSGSGTLRKTGGGALVFTANNTYSGATIINEGSLVLTGSGALANSPSITLASGTTFDFSSASASYTLASGRTIAGLGNVVGSFTNASGSTINPGSNTVAGTLTFTGSLNQSGGAVNHFDLTATPGLGNDRINIAGDLNVSGINTIEIVGGGAPGTVHTLFGYDGSFNGSLANFNLTGASGSLSNDVVGKTIAVTIATAVRNPTNVIWLGNATSNNWDSVNLTNWLNAGDSSLTYFVAGDHALFDDTGIANNNITLVGNNAPATLTVGAAGNYTFGGAGAISGPGGLTKTNLGTLTINTVNSYEGPTVITGGVLEAATLANGNNNSSLGASGPGAANLVVDGAALRYTGGTISTDRGATLNAGGATIDVSTGGAVLTLSGSLTGAGSLTKAGPGTLVLNNANNYTGGSVITAGTLQAGNATALGTEGITNNSATLRLQSALTISSIVEWNGPTALELSGVGAGNAALRGAWVGGGTVNIYFITAAANQTFTIGGAGAGGGHMWDFSGTVDFNTNSGFLRINNDNTTYNFGSSNATFNVGTGTGTLNQRNGGTTTHLGALNGGPTTTLSGRGNTGSAGITTYSIGGKNVDCTFAGNIVDGAGVTAITKVGTARLTLSGTGTHTGLTSVEAGVLQIDGSYGGSAVTVLNGATLQGNGTLGGGVVVNLGGVLSPGASVGRLSMTSSLQLDFGSTNYFEIDKANGTNDAVVGLSSVVYGGVLIVTNLGGTLAEGDTFKLFEAAPGSYSGAFESITLPGLSGNLYWNTNNLAVDGTLSVAAPRPAVTGAGIDAGNFYLVGNNGGVTNTEYVVLTATDVTTPAASWIPVETNTFELDGTFGFTNAVNTAEPARFYWVRTR